MVRKNIYLLLALFLVMFISFNIVSATTYVLNGTIMGPNGNVLNGTLINLTMTDFGIGAENDVIYSNATYSDENGRFSISYESNVSNDTKIYSPVIRYTNTSTNSVQYVGQNIPGFPASEFSMLHDVNFYLTEAGAINITAINSSGGRRAFNYMILDSKLGSEVAYAWSGNGSAEVLAYVPKNRNYSITLYPIRGMPINYEWTNFSADSSYVFSDGLSRYNYTTKTLQKQFNTTESFGRVTGYINYSGIIGWEEFSIVAFTVQSGNRISISHSMPWNISSWLGGTDIYNLTNGFYNITLPILAEGGTALLMAVAKNSSYYAGFRNISLASGRETNVNFTLYGMLGQDENYSVSQGQKNISMKLQSFNLINSTNSTLSAMDGFFEITLDYSSSGAMEFKFERDMDSSEDIDLSFPMLNVTGFKEINVYTPQYSPKRVSSKNPSQISGVNGNNITLSQFNPGDIDGSNIANSISIELYKSNSSCDYPNPGAGCLLTSTNGVSNFNPLSVVIGGGALSFRMGLVSSNIIVHYVNVDLLASGPPDALFDDSANASTSDGFDSAMRFGGNGPKIYDYVLISMPYLDGSSSVSGLNDSAPVNMSIPNFYDENWNSIWSSSNGSNASALAGNYSHYSSKMGEWQTLMNPNTCITNVSRFNASNPCYIDTFNNTIWIRLPHFSGTQPSISGSAILASSEDEDDDSGSGGSGGSEVTTLTETQLTKGITQTTYVGGVIKFKVGSDNHMATLMSIKDNKVTVRISSTPQTVVLGVGETKNVDLNGDGKNDIVVSLVKIDAFNKATISLKAFSETPAQTNTNNATTNTGNINTGNTQVDEPVAKKSSLVWWIMGIVVVVLIIVLIALRKKK